MNVSHELNCYSSTTDDSMSLKDRRMKVIRKTEYMKQAYGFSITF